MGKKKGNLIEFSRLAEDVSRVTSQMLSQSAKRRTVTRDRRRVRFSFWLEMDKVEHIVLGNWIDDLKRSRQFAPIIRTALSLFRELKLGDTAMLYELFPDIKPTPPVPSMPSPENEELKKRISILEGQVEILNQVIVGLKLPTAIDNAVKMSSGAGERTPRQTFTPRPPVVDAPLVMTEADTSSSFLDMF